MSVISIAASGTAMAKRFGRNTAPQRTTAAIGEKLAIPSMPESPAVRRNETTARMRKKAAATMAWKLVKQSVVLVEGSLF